MRNTHKKCLLNIFIIALLLNCIGLYAQDNSVHYPESSVVREQLIETWFTQDLALLRDQSTEILQNELGEYFLVRAEEKDGIMEIIVAPLVVQTLDIQSINIEGETETQSPPVDAADIVSELAIETWPKDGIGSWILYRDSQSGISTRIRYHFMNERDVFIDFFPGNEKSFANFSVYGAHVAHNVPIPVSLEYFYTATLKDIQKLTQNILPWEYASVYDNQYGDSIQMVHIIRQLLPAAKEAQMFESDTSHFDFLKWIVDGLVKPLTGGLLYDEPLYEPTIEPDYIMPERLDTHKSYDYVRNLAAAALSADTSIRYTYETSSADVQIEPFAVMTNSSGIQERVNFVTDIGYKVNLLDSLLYILTVTEGDLFYLGAIRERQESFNVGKTSERHYYNNAVAIFSWFDALGKFNVSVFENGVEYTLDQFIERYPNTFVYLVRIKPSMNFFPETPKISEHSDTSKMVQ